MSDNDLHPRDEIAPHSKLESLDDILAAAQASRVLIQNFVPLAESLDWELGQFYWKRQGSQAFINGEVPYVINNDGSLSGHAAEIFFAGLQAAEANGRLEERIFALELGVGIGLFALAWMEVKLCDHFPGQQSSPIEFTAIKGGPTQNRVREETIEHNPKLCPTPLYLAYK